MKAKLFFCVVVLALVNVVALPSFGQGQFVKTLGGTNDDAGGPVIQTSDGGFVITGSTKSFGAGDWDFLLAKCDALGNPIWAKTLGGSSTDCGFSMIQTFDGGFVVTGYTNSFGVR
jgi:hypothetical protein